MKDSIDTIISRLENEGPFTGAFILGGKLMQRLHPDDAAIVSLTRWELYRDGTGCPQGTDILIKRKTRFGANMLYVIFRKAGADKTDGEQIVYQVELG